MASLIFDSPSLFARSWYAAKETPQFAVELFVSKVLQLLDMDNGPLRVPIDGTLFAWEGASKTEKIRKEEKPDVYFKTRAVVKDLLSEIFDAGHGYHPDFEADDIVATAAFNCSDKAYVVSGDKDLMQLQDQNISYYCLNTKSILPARVICNKFHVKHPSQVAIALAILGDRSDGVPGIHGWGPKRVKKLFERVKPEMRFEEALQAIEHQIPGNLAGIFMYSLDKTLLHNEIPNVPAPRPVKLCGTAEFRDMGLTGLLQQFLSVAMQYDEIDVEAMLPRRT